jgi:hypothetical protein
MSALSDELGTTAKPGTRLRQSEDLNHDQIV